MIKKTLIIASALLLLLSFSGCSEKTKALTCDNCAKEIQVAEDSNMNEEWAVFCEECEESLSITIPEEN